jgi:hypothetical protein
MINMQFLKMKYSRPYFRQKVNWLAFPSKPPSRKQAEAAVGSHRRTDTYAVHNVVTALTLPTLIVARDS